ncbi:hypothetical protein ACLMJK_004704 [Lecanora helva]
MYLQANPNKGKDEQGKEEIKRRYKPGESVLPKVQRRKERSDEAQDRIMMEEIREMSLRDVGVRSSGSYERGVRHQSRDHTRAAHGRERQPTDQSDDMARPSTATDAAQAGRQVEHQSSLRSLLSSSDIDSSEMKEEILRQIIDEGLLDGIDLNNIDVSREDELSEKIAEAYRRRHGQRSRARAARAERSVQPVSSGNTAAPRVQHRRQGRSPNTPGQTPNSSHPPLSRPQLLEVYPTDHGYRRRTASETRRHTSPSPSSRASTETQRPAARSATDLTSAASSTSNRRAPVQSLSSSGRRITDPENLPSQNRPRSNNPRSSRSPASRSQDSISQIESPAVIANSTTSPQHLSPSIPISTTQGAGASLQVQSQQSANTRNSLSLYTEPSISCERCRKSSIEYELHWNCSICHGGNYNLCSSCYRSSFGCLHWAGFGGAAMQLLDGHAQNHTPRHRLQGHRYIRPPAQSVQSASNDESKRLQSTSNPKTRLQAGPFCSNCLEFTPDCYWNCDVCNSGEWGFCDACVNQGRCCTHALLPLIYDRAQASTNSSPPEALHLCHSAIGDSTTTASQADSYITGLAHAERYKSMTLRISCDICTYPIPPSTTRFHCPQCNSGNFDIDAPCYHKLVRKGRISAEDGPRGWRRCPNGHRMTVVGFEDSNVGQRRIVVADLVGGHAFKDDRDKESLMEWKWRDGQQSQHKTTSRGSISKSASMTDDSNDDSTPQLLKKYPPDGGIGMQFVARWSWWPQEGASDELAFPKGAEIRECEDVNGDWFCGVYCARMGFFPSKYGSVIGKIGMG